ncbi:hypothetical protein C1645_830442 [Glomus cerebriforme]|uniref:Ion transport domain-containing protein n=1 Tax=Glomus cerebriforme TaxID=658196 RepID=A0A397SLB4_9GLOM|nr:hypothetical protein C1645_830442 [Glomus cerebriforme]
MLSLQKIHQTPSYLYPDEEKAEIRSISSFDSKHYNKKDLYDGHQYIAISPDGTNIVTLNTVTYQLKLCKFDNLSKFNTLNYNGFKNFDAPSVNWSLAVSNEFTLADETSDILIAVSCFVDDVNNFDDTNIIKHTWIISVTYQSRISSSINDMGGIVKFLDDKDNYDTTDIILINARGINKFSLNHEKIKDMMSENYEPGWFNIFSDKSVKNFYLPNKISDDRISSFFIQQSLVKGRYFVENYKNKVQMVEMYNLKTNLLEHTFQKSEESAASVVGKGSSCFAISNNESLFAYCRGANSITIYLMENGLEVTTKKFNENNVRILFFEFIQDDNKLLIVIEEESYNEDTAEFDFTPIIIVWDLFSSSDNSVRKINDTFSLFPTKSDHHQRSDSSLTNFHSIYDSSGKFLDSKTENRIIRNPEPWIRNKDYIRTSVYLDVNKTIQLFIGESTVQVWHKGKSATTTTASSSKKISSSNKVLKYIWSNNYNRPMQVKSLEIGNKEFSLKLYIPSGESPTIGNEIILEWPEKVNPPVDACQALEFFDKKKGQTLDPKKQHQFEDLVQQTERIHLHIPRCYSWGGAKKETDLEIAIKSTKGRYRKDTVVVKYFLDYYSDNGLKSSSWMFTVSKSIPILYEYNLEFYVKELFQKPCFGASEIYSEQFNRINKAVNKGTHKGVHSLNITLGLVEKNEKNNLQKSIAQGKQSGKRMISTIASKTISASDPSPSLINQIYVVPLPDFIVYPDNFDEKREAYWKIPFKFLKLLFWPRGHVFKKESQMSPFLRMIRKDDSAEIYDNPSMAAVIDFKWNAARNHFLRHALIYLMYALIYAILTDSIKGATEVLSTLYGIILLVLFYWLGFYLLNTERIQLKYEGWKRYIGLYNFFDLISVIIPMAVICSNIYYGLKYNDNNPQNIEQALAIFNSFAILIMWIELFLVIVLGFGHAMYVLLNDTKAIGVDPNGSSFQITDGDGNILPYKVDQVFNVDSISDNYFTNFVKSVESVFFWTGGRWDQLDQWDFWPVDVYSIIASILLVTILQNMLITIMGGAYDDAKEIGKHAVLQYRAELIEDYETVEKPLGSKKGNPRYIYYVGKSDYIELWLKESEKARKNHEKFLASVDNSNSRYDDDDDDGDDDDQELYGYSVDSDSIASPRREQEIPLSSYWFVDEEYEDKNKDLNTIITSSPIQIIQNDSQDESKMLKDKIQSMEKEFSGKLVSMEENIKNLISLLQNQQ